MSRLVTTNHYEARVLVARLGAEGIVAEQRSSAAAQYPGGPAQIWVLTSQLAAAQSLLEPVGFEAEGDDAPPARRRSIKVVALAVLAGIGLALVVPVVRVLLM